MAVDSRATGNSSKKERHGKRDKYDETNFTKKQVKQVQNSILDEHMAAEDYRKQAKVARKRGDSDVARTLEGQARDEERHEKNDRQIKHEATEDRENQKADTGALKSARETQANRTPTARTRDAEGNAREVLSPGDSRAVKRWQRAPGRRDLRGVDTEPGTKPHVSHPNLDSDGKKIRKKGK